jgi:hypothetical protein
VVKPKQRKRKPAKVATGRAAKPAAKKTVAKGRQAAAKSATAKAAKKPAAKRKQAAAKPAKGKRAAAKSAKKAPRSWVSFVEKHGVVLASARGPVPTLAEQIAGEPIVGSWWAHPKGKVIFDALSELDDSYDIRCFKLIDGKVTFVHRRLWPALVRLAQDGMFLADQVAAVQQEHTPTGEHRNLITAFPEWVPDDVALEANHLDVAAAKAQLGAWVDL